MCVLMWACSVCCECVVFHGCCVLSVCLLLLWVKCSGEFAFVYVMMVSCLCLLCVWWFSVKCIANFVFCVVCSVLILYSSALWCCLCYLLCYVVILLSFLR